jgi:hypothetical protein
MTVFTDTSDSELMYSHCYNVKHCTFSGSVTFAHVNFSTIYPPKKQYLLRIAFLGGLKL